jgi:hypothetical protein
MEHPMRYFLMFLCFLAIAPLSAENIGGVDYRLPKQGKGWKMVGGLEGGNESKTILYVPSNASRDTAREIFGVSSNNLPIGPTEQEDLEQTIKLQYPTQTICINILDRNAQSVMFEWSVIDGSQEKVHGWTRTFSTLQGTVVLLYQTNDIRNVNQARPIWVKVLSEAKLSK